MKICIITPDYPDSRRSVFTFVKQLVDEWAAQGHQCYVIAPFSITRNKKFAKFKEQINFVGGGSVTVLRPNILSFSTFKICGFEPTKWLTEKAVCRVLNLIAKDVDCVYCHFWASGVMAYEAAKANALPLIVATGESVIPEWVSNEKYRNFHKYVSGVVCVSSKNRDESIENGLTVLEKCEVFPNAINPSLFKKLSRSQCRKILGLPEDAFIVVFVGWFNERKGAMRVVEALNSLQDNTIHSIFIGSGPEDPKCENILFKGRVSHDQISLYLNASDVFVLPTLHEGCCNAVVEAMSCGLPIISSDLSFNHDVLDSSNSIMINPCSIEEIAEAIKLLRVDDKKRKMLSLGALQSSTDLNIYTRAKRIAEFITIKLGTYAK